MTEQCRGSATALLDREHWIDAPARPQPTRRMECLTGAKT